LIFEDLYLFILI